MRDGLKCVGQLALPRANCDFCRRSSCGGGTRRTPSLPSKFGRASASQESATRVVSWIYAVSRAVVTPSSKLPERPRNALTCLNQNLSPPWTAGHLLRKERPARTCEEVGPGLIRAIALAWRFEAIRASTPATSAFPMISSRREANPRPRRRGAARGDCRPSTYRACLDDYPSTGSRGLLRSPPS